MATTTTNAPLGVHEKLDRAPSRLGILIFGGVMILGLIFIGASIAGVGIANHPRHSGFAACSSSPAPG
jgi:hypothetical protein